MGSIVSGGALQKAYDSLFNAGWSGTASNVADRSELTSRGLRRTPRSAETGDQGPVTVRSALPISVKEPGVTCRQTCAWTEPADSPGKLGVSAVDCVGKGTVKAVLPVSAVARAWPSSVVPRMKLMTGSP